MAKKATAYGVGWSLPDGKGSFKKRPFMRTTQVIADWMFLLAKDGCTFNEVADRSPYDPEATTIAEAFIQAGYGDQPLSNYVKEQ